MPGWLDLSAISRLASTIVVAVNGIIVNCQLPG